jgi:hypothetical protein
MRATHAPIYLDSSYRIPEIVSSTPSYLQLTARGEKLHAVRDNFGALALPTVVLGLELAYPQPPSI